MMVAAQINLMPMTQKLPSDSTMGLATTKLPPQIMVAAMRAVRYTQSGSARLTGWVQSKVSDIAFPVSSSEQPTNDNSLARLMN